MSNQKEKIDNMFLDENYKYWLGGFIEGEGSLIISVVKSDKALFGFLLQPEFNITQHYSGLEILKSFKSLFDQRGQINKKSGSLNVWVYFLIPFYMKYVVCYSNKYKIEEFNKFCYIIKRLDNKIKCTKNQFIELVKLTYKLNPNGKGKNRKRTLDEVISLLKKNVKKNVNSDSYYINKIIYK